MPVFKNEDNGTWYVMARYVNWKGERKQKCKRGFAKMCIRDSCISTSLMSISHFPLLQ